MKNTNSFSTLIRSKFNEAAGHFSEDSIDILHIDGRHGYNEIKEDFEIWKPKLSANAVVLLHGTNVREREFEIWRYFRDLGQRYRTFEFLHGHGLGVLAVGDIPAPLAAFFNADETQTEYYRKLYAKLGAFVGSQQKELARSDGEIENRRRCAGPEALGAPLGLETAPVLRRFAGQRHEFLADATALSQPRHGDAVSVEHVAPRRWQLLKLRWAAARRHPFNLEKQKRFYRNRELNYTRCSALSGSRHNFTGPYSSTDYSIAVPISYNTKSSIPQFAVLLHVYNTALAPEFRNYLENLDCEFDVFISTTCDEAQTSIARAFADFLAAPS